MNTRCKKTPMSGLVSIKGNKAHLMDVFINVSRCKYRNIIFEKWTGHLNITDSTPTEKPSKQLSKFDSCERWHYQLISIMQYFLSEFIVTFDRNVNCIEPDDQIIVDAHNHSGFFKIPPAVVRHFKNILTQRAIFLGCEIFHVSLRPGFCDIITLKYI